VLRVRRRFGPTVKEWATLFLAGGKRRGVGGIRLAVRFTSGVLHVVQRAIRSLIGRFEEKEEKTWKGVPLKRLILRVWLSLGGKSELVAKLIPHLFTTRAFYRVSGSKEADFRGASLGASSGALAWVFGVENRRTGARGR